ncbi:MAG: VOC family protein, partial [Acidimicrobiia bacterium]|nr:VOC family protein [Acidimicrobiia bacterium]
PQFRFTEAVSLVVPCQDQSEVDHYWTALTEGGEEGMCGWLKDRFGLSWQIVPTELGEILSDPDPERAARATGAMLQMRKLDAAALRVAAEGADA